MPVVGYSRSALRSFKRLERADPGAVAALRGKIERFAGDPGGDHPWARTLTGQDGVRIRQGDYRAILSIDKGPPVVIEVARVEHRKDVYR